MARILVVDDDERNLRLVAAALEQGGHEVVGARSGAEGIELARRPPRPDLVLMDVQMPAMSGITAMRILRGDPDTAGLTVVALTALAMKGDRERMLAEGFDGYIEKPIRYREFLASVAALVARAPA